MHLEQPRLKINRANQHIAELKARIVRLHETDTARVDIDPEQGCEILTHEFSDTTAFDDIALILGDAVHNLNCALDYTWLQTLERLIPALVDDWAKFPVRKDRKELEGWMIKAGINTARPNLFRLMLDHIKSHYGGDSGIWPVHRLDINDKHRLLIPVFSRATIKGIEIMDEYGDIWPGTGVSASLQRPPYVIKYKRGLHIKEKGKLTATIATENIDSPYAARIPETIREYAVFILDVVEIFEQFLETELT